MAFTSLLVCSDAAAVQILSRILKDMDVGVENCGDPAAAGPRLSEQRFDVLVVDCQNEAAAIRLITLARASIDNRATVVIAIVDAKNDEAKLTSSGASFLLYKPISAERAASSLQAARGLIRYERRQSRRVPVDADTSMAYAATENVTARLVNISEEGIAVKSQSRLPTRGKVYFQFILPGQASAIRLSGEVTRQDVSGVAGIRFVDVPQSSRRALKEWMQAHLSQQPELTLSVAPSGIPVKLQPQVNLSAGLGLLSSATAERRGPSRHSCAIGAEVYKQGSATPNRCSLSDISTGGCYVETREPFPAGTELEIVVRAGETKLRIQGKVRSTHPGFGTGVQFTLGNDEQRQQVQRLLECQVAGPKVFA